MATLRLNGVEVYDVEIDGVDFIDYPKFSDAYIGYAVFADNTELTDDELELLTEQNPGMINELAHEQYADAGDYLCERD